MCDQMVACARIFTVILSDAELKGGDELLRSRQCLLKRIGVVRVMLRLVQSQLDALYESGLQLGFMLLKGGNVEVQTRMVELLSDQATGASAMDGTPATFFQRVRAALRLAVKEIPERIAYIKGRRDYAAHFDDVTAGLSGATVALLRADLHAPFVTRAHPDLLLRFLKETCEGHFAPMQDLLSDQPFAVVDIDFAAEVCELVLQLAVHLDASNVPQVVLAIEALTEFVQGHVSGKNAATLLETKLLELCNRLLTRPLDATGADEAATAAFASIPLVVLTLLHAMLEHGHVDAAIGRMSDALELPAIASLAARWSRVERGSAPGGALLADAAAAPTTAAAEVGVLAFNLLWKITDRFPEKAGSFKDGRPPFASMTEAAARHYQQNAGRVEIVNAEGVLERVYFRKPSKVALLPKKSKDRVLWSVDRETAGVGLQEFVAESKGLWLEMVWQEALSSVRLLQKLVHHEGSMELVSIVIAVAQNALILLDSTFFHAYGEPDRSANVYAVVRSVLGAVQIATCGLVAVVVSARSTFLTLLVQESQRREAGDEHGAAADISAVLRLATHPFAHPELLPRFAIVASRDVVLLRKLAFLTCAVLGVSLSERWYSVHLFQVTASCASLVHRSQCRRCSVHR